MVSSKALTNISQHRTDSKFRLSDSFFLKTLKVYGQSIDLDFLLTESHCNYNISHDISLSYSHLNFFFSWDLWITSRGVTKWFQVFKVKSCLFIHHWRYFLSSSPSFCCFLISKTLGSIFYSFHQNIFKIPMERVVKRSKTSKHMRVVSFLDLTPKNIKTVA